MTTIHVSPVADLIEHDTDGGECPTHHSLDGREQVEADR